MLTKNNDMQNIYEESFTRNIGVISVAEQEKLKNSRVTVVGAGGVGGITLIQLARMGVGSLHVIDQDVFEASNINRQMLSSNSKLGQQKADVALEVLQDINPLLQIEITKEFVTEDNALEFLTNTDVIIDATDNLVARVIIHRTAQKLGIPSIWIAVTPPFRGGVMSLTPDSTPYEIALGYPSYQQELTLEMQNKIHKLKDGRALHSVKHGADEKWANNYVQENRPWAVLSPVANIVGILASFEAFKFIINREDLKPVISPNLIQINLASQNMVHVSVPKNDSWDYTTL
ncbi:HesA/MoeB/ThiF family protein [Bacillus cereus]|uniref:HesA/MoeB/ThiF family protein n=1 Tax=Bacillus cereus TaxID=1396 RepID=UPI000BF53E12|nr:ThiF family adenylyltransferase [Bacillus cereus]PES09220.1 molybdopterin biosynthesis protein MoeB [Bacillus cereus]PEX12465.1 molybdopterin biosynthesis protein MoeB [Bacillus cereus]PFU07546.1 molybdopterin biosynthesis protein MoeB [Bacillus cereus]PGW68901.1 molybdopterin biosynthesis protein MoeB [Bacillus cereus]